MTKTEAHRGPIPAGLSDEKAARILIGLRAGSTLRPFIMKASRFKGVLRPELGQTEKHSAPGDVFRSSPKNGPLVYAPKYCADQLLWNLLGESPPKQPMVGAACGMVTAAPPRS
jgi:hypothetical protein